MVIENSRATDWLLYIISAHAELTKMWKQFLEAMSMQVN
jgi:hypothetical protein